MPKWVRHHLKTTAMYPVARIITRAEFDALVERVGALEAMVAA
jgi:hypothetical protein